MAYNSKYTGQQVEALLDIVKQGGSSGGEGGTITEAELLAMGFTKNLGTITEVKMNGASKGTSGVVDLGTVITEHQDISGKQDKIADLDEIRSNASMVANKQDIISDLATIRSNASQVSSKQDAISDLDAIRSGASKGATALQSIPEEYVTEADLEDKDYAPMSVLDNKVDKVSGKGLSTEDFTSALKAKLESLSNYNDAEIAGAVSSLQTQINALVSGNADDAINSFNEIIAFLAGVKDSEDLDNIIASIERQIAEKQDIISDLATIRTNASKGATAVQPSSLASVATSGSYNDLTNKPTIPSAVTESTVSGWGFTKNSGTYSKPSTGIPKTDLASTVQTSLSNADTAYQKPSTGIPVSDFKESVRTELTRIGEVTNGYSGTNAISTAIGNKQDKLVSGTNIKTINNQSLLGSGNITIEGGGGGGSSSVGYPYEYVEVEPNQTLSLELQPNRYYEINVGGAYGGIGGGGGSVGSSTLNISIGYPLDNDTINEYLFMLDIQIDCSVILPDNILWANDKTPEFAYGKSYIISIVGYSATFAEFNGSLVI